MDGADIELQNAKNEAELYMDLMSHDLTNMHQISMGFIELAMDELERTGKLDKDKMFMLQKSHDALKSSSKIVCRVMAIKKHNEGAYKQERVDISEILDKIISENRNERVKIHYEEMCGKCIVIADELMLPMYKQIVDNAIKHSTGQVNINIILDKVRVNDVVYCRVVIEDDGPGIPDVLKNRLYKGLRTKHCTGFGSYAVANLVKSYNGRILVEDRVHGDAGKGTRVLIEIPEIKE